MGKVGIIGSGQVGQALARGFLSRGDQVMLGSRDPSKLSDWKAQQKGAAKTGSFEETAAFADMIVLAVKGAIALEALALAGADNLADKLVVDVTNPLSDDAPVNGVLKFYTNLNESNMERLQKAYPKVRFVKAFNSVGSALMVNPDFNGIKPTMFICGNNEEVKKKLSPIIEEFGWEVEDMGSAEAARAIEPLCMLWCIPGFRENRWNHAFKLLK